MAITFLQQLFRTSSKLEFTTGLWWLGWRARNVSRGLTETELDDLLARLDLFLRAPLDDPQDEAWCNRHLAIWQGLLGLQLQARRGDARDEPPEAGASDDAPF
jgi:hypothetical protein